MTTDQIREHFVSRADWVDDEKTVDRIIIGDGGKEVRRCLVTWISSFAAVRAAVERGMDLLITHEPTFYAHTDELGHLEAFPVAGEKKRFIEEHGLTVLRLHDTWDRWPEVGIPFAWAQFLGLGPAPVAIGANGYQHRYDVETTTLGDFAREMARRTATIGESAVQVTGDPQQSVSKIGVNTGCACSIAEFRRLGCDLSIVCDDGSCYWREIQAAADAGHAVIRVNHGTSEEPGMLTLTQYINDHLPDVSAEHLPHGPTFRLIGF